ncbi:MAG: RsmB/NOP family class I SAM-dependent RNA methyltransferase [Candidatus Kapabacteria bacterium]|nr:RsmB/NOP family class I SAM-dependent RNA methyltransferase [Candidatus Kapabacteria bacterium]
MLPETLFLTSAEILKIAFKSSQPTDLVLSKLLREKKYIGSKERRFVSESVYTILRNLTYLEKCSEAIFGNTEKESDIDNSTFHYTKLILSLLLISDNDSLGLNYNPNQLLIKVYPNTFTTIQSTIFSYLLKTNYLPIDEMPRWQDNCIKSVRELSAYFLNAAESNDSEYLSEAYSCPVWILDNVEKSGFDRADFAKSLTVPAPVCLRVTDISGIDAVAKMLDSRDIPYHYSTMLKNCIILDKRGRIDDSEEYLSGMFEVQDEGSQLIAYSLAPEGAANILDACAGAGGKTLQIANICPAAVQIVASDNEYLRLKELSKRLRRYNISNISIKHARTMEYESLDDLYGGRLFDYILIDAPCTGIGTARRDPLKKFRLTQKLVEKMQKKQLEILAAYSRFVKPDGILLYATCSVLREENQDVVDIFLAENPEFEPDNLYDVFHKNDINPLGIKPDSFYQNLMPHIHSTDGFFMARMRRVV